MKFGSEPTTACVGAIIAHGHRFGGGGSIKKGHVLSQQDVDRLVADDVREIVVARLEDGDISENDGARRVADALTGLGLRTGVEGTGRVNIYADTAGLLQYDRDRLKAVNSVTENITVAAATLDAPLKSGQLAATAKILPLGVALEHVEEAQMRATTPTTLFSVAPFRPQRIGLVQTLLSGSEDKVLEKTRRIIDNRAALLSSEVIAEIRVPHAQNKVADALTELLAEGCNLILIMGASVTTDRRDVIPSGIVAAGGTVTYFGMPVDPGNLLVLGAHGAIPIIAFPGSARSPRRGGNDWILEHIAAGLPVGPAQIVALGEGGLLKEIPSRPMPREIAAPATDRQDTKTEPSKNIAAVLLAAGQSRRMGRQNKLLAAIDGVPMVVRAATELKAAGYDPIVAVLGHQAAEVRAALSDLDISFAENPNYADGLSTSLTAGINALPATCPGALVALGDMPFLTSRHYRALGAAFRDRQFTGIVVPKRSGKRGNPVLWARAYFDELTKLEGDIGARHLIEEHGLSVCDVDFDDEAIFRDVDTPSALADARVKPDR